MGGLYIFISRTSHRPENKDEREFSEMLHFFNPAGVTTLSGHVDQVLKHGNGATTSCT
jgi:hypothetical protein